MENLVALLIILAAVGGAVIYIVRQKKAGVKCIGCSVGEACAEKAKSAESAGEGHACSCGCGSVDQMLYNMEQAAK